MDRTLETILMMLLAAMSAIVMAKWMLVADTELVNAYADPAIIRKNDNMVKPVYLLQGHPRTDLHLPAAS